VEAGELALVDLEAVEAGPGVIAPDLIAHRLMLGG